MTEPQEGDRAFREEILPELDAVYRFALRLSGDPDRAQDLTQETFLRAYRNREKYTPGTRAKSWLFTICRNVFLRGEERTRRHEEIVSEAADSGPGEAALDGRVFKTAQEADPEGEFWRRVVDEEILRAIDRLPEPFRTAVTLVDREALSYEEAAGVLDVATGTLKSRLYRGRRLLQRSLYDHAVEAGIVTPPRPPTTPGTEPRDEPST